MSPSGIELKWNRAQAEPSSGGTSWRVTVPPQHSKNSTVDLKDWDEVAALLGRQPRCSFEVVVRTQSGAPRVIRNDPLLFDGTPMPTLFWLVDPQDCKRISQIESAGGVRQAEQAVDSQALVEAHQSYARERDAGLPDGYDGPKPSGGVGGCAVGVKCLHAHYAWFLAGGDDPVGRWVDDRMANPAG